MPGESPEDPDDFPLDERQSRILLMILTALCILGLVAIVYPLAGIAVTKHGLIPYEYLDKPASTQTPEQKKAQGNTQPKKPYCC